jgi:hypothetical protein
MKPRSHAAPERRMGTLKQFVGRRPLAASPIHAFTVSFPTDFSGSVVCLTPKFSRMRLDGNLQHGRTTACRMSAATPTLGDPTVPASQSGKALPKAVRRRAAGWSTRVARRAGVRVRVPVNGCLSAMAGDSIRVRAPGLPQRSCRAAPRAAPCPPPGCKRATVRPRVAWSGGA